MFMPKTDEGLANFLLLQETHVYKCISTTNITVMEKWLEVVPGNYKVNY